MNASSEGSTTQPSVSAHQSASTCGWLASTAIWKSTGIGVVSFRPVQVSEQRDLSPVVQGLAVDVQDERNKRIVRVRALGRAARTGKAVIAEAAHPFDPGVVGAVELRQRLASGAGVVETVPVDGRAAEVPGVARPEYA